MVVFERGVETRTVVVLGGLVFLGVTDMLSLNVIDPRWWWEVVNAILSGLFA